MEPLEKAFLRDQREKLFHSIQGNILEIGVGTGTNQPFLQNQGSVILSEPSWTMCQKLREKNVHMPLQILTCPAEELPFSDECFDIVVSTLVLCTVPHPLKALYEIRRILRPNGRLLFLEHIRAQGLRSIFQSLFQPLWTRIGCGCHPNRKTLEFISSVGLKIRQVEFFNPSRRMHQPTRILMQLTLPFVRGTAEKIS